MIDKPPVRFRRSAGMQPLPMPERGGSIDALRAFLNVKSDEDFVLVVAWMLAVLRDRGPYPLLVLSGEQGSAKSTFSAILRALLDPNTAPLRALPREDRDLFIAANNGACPRPSTMSRAFRIGLSDTLCRLATGGGFAVRQLYTDHDEVLFDAARPVILNGIEDLVSRPDLADRAVFLTLEPIPEDRRRPEAELRAAFEAERSRLLGVLLDALVEGLKRLPETELPVLPRMADFALWATACETALWPTGTFWSAYVGNRDAAVEDVIEADPVAAAACAASWTSERRGRERRRTCSKNSRRLSGIGSQSPKLGQQILAPCPAVCVVPRPSCVKSASKSPTARKVAPEPGSLTSRPKGLQPGQISTRRNRLHRLQRLQRLQRRRIPVMARRMTIPERGRSDLLRTQKRIRAPRPSVPTRQKTVTWTLQTVRTQIPPISLNRAILALPLGRQGYDGGRGCARRPERRRQDHDRWKRFGARRRAGAVGRGPERAQAAQGRSPRASDRTVR